MYKKCAKDSCMDEYPHVLLQLKGECWHMCCGNAYASAKMGSVMFQER